MFQERGFLTSVKFLPAFRFLLSAFLCLVFLTGCAAVPPRAPEADRLQAWTARAQALAPLTVWEVRGRLALATPDEGWQAQLRWVRRRNDHRIDLIGPLGRGHLRLTQDARGATLHDGEHTYRDGSAEQLLARTFGWSMPLDGLGYWLRGLPAPDAPARRDLDACGRLARLEQRDWDIHYLEYARFGEHELPSKVFLTRTALGRDTKEETVEVRLVIERWELRNEE